MSGEEGGNDMFWSMLLDASLSSLSMATLERMEEQTFSLPKFPPLITALDYQRVNDCLVASSRLHVIP